MNTLNAKSLKLLIQNQRIENNSVNMKHLESQRNSQDQPQNSIILKRTQLKSNEKEFRIRNSESVQKKADLMMALQSGFLEFVKKAPVKQPSISPEKIFLPKSGSLLNVYYKRTNRNPLIQQNMQFQIKQQPPSINNSSSNLQIVNNKQISRSQYISGEQATNLPQSSSLHFPKNMNVPRKHSMLHQSSSQIITNPDMNSQDAQITKQDFKLIYVIGKGGFGRVWKVEHNKTKKLYAMKEMSKTKVIEKRSVNSVLNERFLLKHLRHPFLVNIHFAFNDRENLFLVMDLLQGGDLRYHISKMKRFSETQTKYFVACILLSLSYLHKKGIIHRDLKPENLVLDELGFLRLTDLGVAREDKGQNKQDTSGTPGYMAPEVMCRLDHSIQVDYYALGVIAYELMLGKRPYGGRQRQEIREAILARQAQVKMDEIPIGWNSDSADFINQLLQRKPEKRLGAGGPEEVMNHPWIRSFPFEKLLHKKLMSSYVPGQIDGNHDFQAYISEETVLNEEQLSENKIILRRNTVQQLFNDYYYKGHQMPSMVTQKTQEDPRRLTHSRQSSPIKNTINF